jgi:hypothetical protein
MKENHINYFRYAALLPVAGGSPHALPTMHPVTTLALSNESARQLAADAGLILLGQLNAEGDIIKL